MDRIGRQLARRLRGTDVASPRATARWLSASLVFSALVVASAVPALGGEIPDAGAGANALPRQGQFPPVQGAPQSSSSALPAPPPPPPGPGPAPSGSAPPPASAAPPANAAPPPASATPPGRARRAPVAVPAAELPPPLPEESDYTTRWYGWQTLIADAAAFALMAGGRATNTSEVTLTGILGFVLAAPIIHFGHGHAGKGLGSMGLRVGMPLVLGIGILGQAASSSCGLDNSCGNGVLSNLGAGVYVGMAGASIIDAAALARDKVPVAPELALVPMPGRGPLGLAVGGTF